MGSLNTDIVYIPAPVNLDRHIQAIQKKLEGLPWLDKSFGRAYRVPGIKLGYNTPQFYPGRFVGSVDYQDLSRNDTLKAYSFIVAEDNAQYKNSTFDGSAMLTQGVSIIFWLDLSKIDKTKQYIFTEDLRRDVVKILNNTPVEMQHKRYFSDAANVFKGFDTYQKNMMYPYACMRFDITLEYMEEC